MFNDAERDEAEFRRTLSVLRIVLGFVFVTGMLLLYFIYTLFEETFGYCDRRESEGGSSFQILLIVEFLMVAVVSFFYHQAAKYHYASDPDAAQTGLGVSYISYLAAVGIQIYLVLDLFLNGSHEDKFASTTGVVFAVVLSILSFVLLIRTERQLQ